MVLTALHSAFLKKCDVRGALQPSYFYFRIFPGILLTRNAGAGYFCKHM